ncbi:MAG: hypothetical protein ABGX00_11875 [Allomuricauda sp.]
MRKHLGFWALLIITIGCQTGKQIEYVSSEIIESALDSIQLNKIMFSDNDRRLTFYLLNLPPVTYCNQSTRHFVDVIARDKIDSLKRIGVKKVLFYRDWIGTRSFNGYGKLIWIQNEKCFQHQLNFENYDGRYGVSSIDKSELKTCEALEFYITNKIDTVQSSPKESEIFMSHASDHFIYTSIDGNENCFNVSGLDLNADSAHIKSRLVDRLRIPFGDYFQMLEKRRKGK